MKYKILPFLLLVFSISLAQNTVTILDSSTEIPLENVSVYSDSLELLGKSNSKGKVEISEEIQSVILKLKDYEDEYAEILKKDEVVYMSKFSVSLDEAVFKSSDPKARDLIRKSIKNQKSNDPENLASFQYKTYSKFSAQVANKDSIPVIAFPKNKSDSSHNKMKKLVDESLLFLGERAMDHKFDKKFGRKNIVRANRVSGLKTPLYEFVAAQPISHKFDKEKFTFFFVNYANPVSKTGLDTYHYRIIDSVQLNNNNCVVVGFKPKSKEKNKNRIRGKVWIETKNYAVIKFSAEGTGNSIAELEMDWVNYKNYWFPKEQRFLFEAGDWDYPVEVDSIAPDGAIIHDTIRKEQPIWANMINTFKGFQSPVEFERKEFSGYENEVAKDAFDNSNVILESYRNTQLSEIERNTYVKIDSIGEAEKVDKYLKLLRIYSRGGLLELKKVDLDLTRIVAYNNYEGLRLGIPLATNYKFNENFALNGYVAYGFKDKSVKFGGGIDYFVNKSNSGKLFVNYKKDVEASGRTNLLLQNNFAKFRDGSLDNLFNEQFYKFKHFNFGYQQDLFKNVTANLSLNYQEQQTQFGYSYKDFPIDSKFNTSFATLALRWAPKSKFLKTPYGKVTMESGYPFLYFTFNQGLGVLDSDYNPFKFETTVYHSFRSFAGRTGLRINGGVVLGDAPLNHLFEGYGVARNGESIGGRFGIASGSGFETMRPGEFYSDRFVSFQVKHRIKGFKLLGKRIYPSYIYRGLIGDLDNVENHDNFSFNIPKGYYQEAGIEFDNLFFGVLGVGTYYRFGTYSLGDFNQNFSWKLTLNLPSF